MADRDYWGEMFRALCAGMEALLELEVSRARDDGRFMQSAHYQQLADELRKAASGEPRDG